MHFFRLFLRLCWKGNVSFITYLSMEQLGFHRTSFSKTFFYIRSIFSAGFKFGYNATKYSTFHIKASVAYVYLSPFTKQSQEIQYSERDRRNWWSIIMYGHIDAIFVWSSRGDPICFSVWPHIGTFSNVFFFRWTKIKYERKIY